MCMFICAGIGVALMGISMPFAAMMVVSLFARLAEVAVVSAVWVATPELFPTEHRITGHSVASCMIRIGAFCVPYLVQSSQVQKSIIGIVLGCVNFIGFIAVSFLPETASKFIFIYFFYFIVIINIFFIHLDQHLVSLSYTHSHGS